MINNRATALGIRKFLFTKIKSLSLFDDSYYSLRRLTQPIVVETSKIRYINEYTTIVKRINFLLLRSI